MDGNMWRVSIRAYCKMNVRIAINLSSQRSSDSDLFNSFTIHTTVFSLWSNIYIYTYIYIWSMVCSITHQNIASRRCTFSYSTTIHELINDKSWREMCRIWRMYIYIYIIHIRKKVSLLHRCCGSSMDWSGQMRNEARWDQQSQWSILYDAHLFYSIHARFSTNTFSLFFFNCFCVWIMSVSTFTSGIRYTIPCFWARELFAEKKKRKSYKQTFVPDNLL